MEWLTNPLRGSVFQWTWMLVSLFYLLWLPLRVPAWAYVAVFVFWRLAYNVGLGYVLWKQSQSRFLTNFFRQQGAKMPEQVKKILATSMSADYRYDAFPAEFNAWVAFRGLVEIVLALDLGTYFLMCFVLFEAPEEITFTVVAGYVVGLFLCFLGLWAKSDAYRVIGDFAWSASSFSALPF